MNEKRYCRYCGKEFSATREDHFFDAAKCVAAYYRANPNPEYIHAEKEHTHTYYCEECGVPFKVNDYADRGGKRVPKYHSTACKQKAYRARGKATQEQAKRRQEGKTAGDTGQNRQHTGKAGYSGKQRQSDQNNQQNANSGHSGNNSGHSGSASDFWSGYQTRYAAAEAILGVSHNCDKKTLRAAYIALIYKFHPDRNKAADALIMTQKINWAYEYLKR